MIYNLKVISPSPWYLDELKIFDRPFSTLAAAIKEAHRLEQARNGFCIITNPQGVMLWQTKEPS